MWKKPVQAILFLGGVLATGLAVFAHAIGLDKNREWGRGRIMVLTLGVFITLCAFFYDHYENKVLAAKEKVRLFIEDHAVVSRLRDSRESVLLSKLWQRYRFTLPLFFLVLLVYVWFASAGLWTTLPRRTNYYSLLAQAFQKRQLFLPVKPSEKLLALSDPYDPAQRQGVGEPTDFSLYGRKFYLYWGPVPALLLFMLGHIDTPDAPIVFVSTSGIFVLQFFSLVAIWDRFFNTLPKWMLLTSILVSGLAVPSAWMLGSGSIYDAPIACAQFFLIGGLTAGFSALDASSTSHVRLLLAGTFWALAIGTRLVLIVPVSFMMLTMTYAIFRSHHFSLRDSRAKVLLLGLPVVMGAMLLGAYNWARFGSPTETGFSYALAGTYLRKHLDQIFSPVYILQNLYNYLFSPPHLRSQFPFIYPNEGSTHAILPFYSLTEIYNTNPVAGLIYAYPFGLFAAVTVFTRLFHVFKKSPGQDPGGASSQGRLSWIIVTLTGASLLTLAFLLTFFWAAMRYIEDFMPAVLVLSAIGFCQGHIFFARSSSAAKVYDVLGVLTAGVSVAFNILIGISANLPSLGIVNPVLFGTLMGIVSH